ncbi:MAG: hypothetical protein IKO83_01885 [Oscillospiraceae bacterium]|nr:hypothetical protein [Oscillospiraceae bacterium]
MNDWKERIKKLAVFKYPFMILLIGVVLLMLPSHQEAAWDGNTAEKALEEVLAVSSGVGRVRVLVSDNGAVVVCEGAEKAAVRLNILRAIGSYTGLGSDRITILEMMDQQGR